MPKKPLSATPSVENTDTPVKEIEEMEALTLEKANHAISAIENAIAIYQATKVQSEEYRLEMNNLKFFHDALANWETELLRGMSKHEEISTRIERLRRFSDICYNYAR